MLATFVYFYEQEDMAYNLANETFILGESNLKNYSADNYNIGLNKWNDIASVSYWPSV